LLNSQQEALDTKTTPYYNQLRCLLIGYLIGDGWISKRKSKTFWRYDLCFYPDNLEMANSFVQAFEELYGKTLNIKPVPGFLLVRTTHKIAVKDLLAITKYDSLNWELPSRIMRSRAAKRQFLRGYFDSEAYVSAKCLRVESVNEKGLCAVQSLLEEFGVQSRMYRYERKQESWNTNYILSIHKKESRVRFLKEIGFNHARKLKRLQGSIA